MTAAVSLVRERDNGGSARHAEIYLAEVADYFALPLRHGLTTASGILGGADYAYGLYRAKGDSWIAVAAFEDHFRARLTETLSLDPTDPAASFAAAVTTRTADEWAAWAVGQDFPIVAVSDCFGDR